MPIIRLPPPDTMRTCHIITQDDAISKMVNLSFLTTFTRTAFGVSRVVKPKPLTLKTNIEMNELQSYLLENETARQMYNTFSVKARLNFDEREKARVYFLRDSLVEIDQSLKEGGKPYCTEQEFDG